MTWLADQLSHIYHLPQNQSSFLIPLFRTTKARRGTRPIDHCLAKKLELESCNPVDSINAILQEQAHVFRKFRGNGGKLMKSLKCSADVLYTLSVGTPLSLLRESISLVCTKAFIEVYCS
jgi:hypothetical protein